MAVHLELFGVQEFALEQLASLSFIPANLRSLLQYHRGFETVNFTEGAYYIYTGRGPSQADFHIGHLPGLKLCLAFQEFLKTPIEFMIADDEKMFRDGITADTMSANVSATLRQLEKIGFSGTNTRFRINSHGLSCAEYALMIRIMSIVSVHTLNSIFGEKTNVGEYFYPLIQLLPCFLNSTTVTAKCIVIAGIDQDPFFRLARDVARRLGFNPPTILYTHSVPGLDGSPKMSTSVPESLPIFLNDGPKAIGEKVAKIKKVGAGSLDELFQSGANLDIDIPFRLVQIFDTCSKNVALLKKAYTAGLRDSEEVDQLGALVPAKGIQERDGKYMLTSHGIRQYLTTLLTALLTT